MKRSWTAVIILLFAAAGVLLADQGKIRVVVEGEEDAVAAKEAVKPAPTAAAAKADSKYTVEKLRKLAEKSSLESEILDGIISKMIDLEDEQAKMKKEQEIKNLALLAGIILVAIAALVRRKK